MALFERLPQPFIQTTRQRNRTSWTRCLPLAGRQLTARHPVCGFPIARLDPYIETATKLSCECEVGMHTCARTTRCLGAGRWLAHSGGA